MASGGLAEEVVVPAEMAIPIPAACSHAEGAAAVVGLMTEHNALVTAARMERGETGADVIVDHVGGPYLAANIRAAANAAGHGVCVTSSE